MFRFRVLCVLCLTIVTPRSIWIPAMVGGMLYKWICAKEDPERRCATEDPEAIVSPCDGTVLDIYFSDDATIRIVIQMDIMDTRTQWYPTHGWTRVVQRSYRHERIMATLIENEYGSMQVDQVVPGVWSYIRGSVLRVVKRSAEMTPAITRLSITSVLSPPSIINVIIPSEDTMIVAREGDRVTGSRTIVAAWTT